MTAPVNNRLSSNFTTYEYTQKMSKLEEYLKSPLALLVGILPFTVANVALFVFKRAALGTHYLDTKNPTDRVTKVVRKITRTITAGIGVGAAGIMMTGAKLFSLSQTLIWGKYVKQPTTDGINTRLAYYGSGSAPWTDLTSITQAFFSPEKLSQNARKLPEWSQVTI